MHDHLGAEPPWLYWNDSGTILVDDIQMGDFYDSFSDERTAYLDDLRLVGPGIFVGDFETGSTDAWSLVTP